MAPPYVTMSWIGLTGLTPLSALVIAWTLVSIHRKRTKSILLLALVYAQLLFQFLNFSFSTLTLLKMEGAYMAHLTFAFNSLILFKSLSLLSLHLEEFYKIKSPSNYILNINSSLLKYHLLVVLLLSLMGAYLLRGVSGLVPTFNVSERLLVAIYVTFHTLILLLSLFLLGLKCLLRKRTLDVNIIIGTNSTSSSANLFGLRDGCGSSGGRQGIAASGVATINLLINSTLLMCVFWKFWLPPTWPLVSVILWSQVTESLLTPASYWAAHARRRGSNSGSHKSSARYHPESGRRESQSEHPSGFQSLTNGSLCFNNGEFQYFAGGKHNSSNSRETVLNNGMSSEYNTFDSFHQARSYTDSLRCASVTTIANDDFEFLPRGQAPSHLHQLELQQQSNLLHPAQFQYDTITIAKSKPSPNSALQQEEERRADTMTTSLSMNDLDLIERGPGGERSPGESTRTNSNPGKYKYKKNAHKIKKRFTSKSLTRRVLSLESLHSNVNESSLAYLDTGERVIVFTTDFI